MSRSIAVEVTHGGNVVAGANVSITDLLGSLVTSGVTDSGGQVTLSVPNDGSYVAIGFKVIAGDSYADSRTFTTSPSGVTLVSLELVRV